MIPRVYLATQLNISESVVLDERARHHVVNVLRLKTGAALTAFNGHGGEYNATLVSSGKKATIDILEHINTTRESPLETHLFQGVSRGERMDYTMQKAAELGATEITPVFTARTTVKIPANRVEKKLTHWRNIVISACEQSGRTKIPTIHAPIHFSDILAQNHTGNETLKIVFDTEATTNFHDISSTPSIHKVHFLVGPESGLEAQEITTLAKAGYQKISLGPRILRTETVAPVALALLQLTLGDLKSGD